MRGSMTIKLLLATTILLGSTHLLDASGQARVATSQGTVEGVSGDGVLAFKGIPFAAPPVGDLRWRPPQPGSSWQGVRKATEFGASCIQPRIPGGERLPWTKEFMVQNATSENCLFLNIWTPRANRSAKLPVVVYIHGGGFSEGSGAIDVYRGDKLSKTDLVVVTINYRLGVLGFLAHPELTAESPHHSSGNYGLLDQIAAFKWVQQNIQAFGGDAGKITIWGQSAGAFSVGALIASPEAAHLFQYAQADSGLGIATIHQPTLAEAEKAGLAFAEEHRAESIKALRALPAESLLPTPGPGAAGRLAFSVITDGWILPATPNELNASGKDNDVPVVTGYQAGDSTMFTPRAPSLEAYRSGLQKRFGEMAAEFERLYPASTLDEANSMLKVSGQDRSRVSMYLWATERVKSHRSAVFTYFFDRGIPWPQHPEFGAFHSGELPYFFLTQDTLERPWAHEDRVLAQQASGYLHNFATNGDPNGNGLPHWPPIDPQHPETMELGVRVGPMPLAESTKVDFWMRYYHSPISAGGSPF